MSTTAVQVPDVPVEVVATLKARAEARGQSLAAYLRELLAREAETSAGVSLLACSQRVTPAGGSPEASW
jgi:hypothetical protein